MSNLRESEHLPTDATIASATHEVELLSASLGLAYPIVERELRRLKPPPGASASAFVEPPPLVKLTIAVAGAGLSTPGIHYLNLYSKEADLRPELYRMTFDRLNEDDRLRGRILTRRTTGLHIAAQGVRLNDNARSRLEIEIQTARCLSPPATPSPYVHVIDLEQLHKEAQFSDIVRLKNAHPGTTVLLHGSREHPCLKGFFTALPNEKDWLAWGVNREQILAIDEGQNHRALHAIASLSPINFDPDTLPERFHDLPVKSIVPAQYRASPLASGRIWTTLAGAYAIRDASRRAQTRRDVIDVNEDLPQAFISARSELEQLTRLLRGNRDAPPYLARWLDDLWYLSGFASRLTAPLHAYIRELQAHPHYQRSPLDILRRIQAHAESPSQDTSLMASVHGAASSLISGYDALFSRQMEKPHPRLERLTIELGNHLEKDHRVGIVALNPADKAATERFLKKWLTGSTARPRSPPPEGKTALEHAGVSVIDARTDIGENLFDVLIVPRYPSPTHLDRLLTSTTRELEFIVPREDFKRIIYDVCRDIVRERRVFSSRMQRYALSRALKKSVAIPACLDIQPEVPENIERIVDEISGARERRAEAKDFDIDHAMRELAEVEATETRSHTVFVPTTTSETTGWKIEFDDGSSDVLNADDALQVLDLDSKETEHLPPSRLKTGMIVITTNDSASSSQFAGQIIATVSRVRPALVPDIVLDRFWRESLRDYRKARGLNRNQFLERAQAFHFTNETPLTLRWYEQRSTWRPLKKSNFVALLRMLEEDKPGISAMVDSSWAATNKLRAISRAVLTHVRDRASTDTIKLLTTQVTGLDIDPVLVPELGLRVSHVDGLFLPKTIVRITAPSGGGP